ncbi:PIN domain-containing protein [Kitasatospora sp. A2-31]|uniref:PIN domain-containing protein n=1 Tax=Kitasatospora sp. A2-31 TaxID=2916414 RepID=UPI001EEC62D8|nr:PIN domain-containing protein [Kitasatospora sp. A2-31]MCG6497308.1 PIN domain-containing protein [Kitasatospora sp. A2-31]
MTDRFETLVLDSQGLSTLVSQDRRAMARLQVFQGMGADVVVCANTIVEVMHARVNMARLNWALSRVKIEAVTEDVARDAANLLKRTGLHGHKYAIDATVAALALRQPGPVAMLASDADEMLRLCDGRVRLIAV